jgi:hypothetical protein
VRHLGLVDGLAGAWVDCCPRRLSRWRRRHLAKLGLDVGEEGVGDELRRVSPSVPVRDEKEGRVADGPLSLPSKRSRRR